MEHTNNTIEIEEKTIDEAIERACREINLPREKINIEILSRETSGFFGIGSKKARIRASAISFNIEEITNPETIKAEEPAREDESPELETEPQAEVQAEDTAVEAKEFLEGILRHMNLDFAVNMEETEDQIILDIKGDGSGLLIGRGGKTLDAMQHIIGKASDKAARGGKRIIIDTENYRKKRDKSLVALAERLGEKVKKTGKPVAVNPMNAHDRRIIHMTLRDDKSLVTKSRGDGIFKKIIIVPSKKSA
jgi:spoIIIJ-associated protein